jgi:hypothetical protein
MPSGTDEPLKQRSGYDDHRHTAGTPDGAIVNPLRQHPFVRRQ